MYRMAFFCGLLLVVCLGVACTNSTIRSPQTLAYSAIVDLSHTVSADMPQLPDAPRTRLIAPDNGEELELSLQSATYLHVPVDINRFRSTEHLSPRELIVPAVVLDVRREIQDNPTYLLTIDMIHIWEWQHGRIPEGSIVLLYSGWDAHWPDPDGYLNLDTDQWPQVPGFSAAATRFLLEKRSAAGLGSDTPSVDGMDQAQRSTEQLLAADGLILENLTGLEHLPPYGATLFIGALKIQAGGGSPVTVLAFVP